MTTNELLYHIERLRPLLISYAKKRMVADPEATVQDVIQRVLRYEYIPDNADMVRSILFSLAKWAVLEEHRQTRRRRDLAGEMVRLDDVMEDGYPTVNPYPLLDLELDVERALAQLPDGVGAAIRLVYMEGYTITEVAKQLGVSRCALQKRIWRAMPALKRALAEYRMS